MLNGCDSQRFGDFFGLYSECAGDDDFAACRQICLLNSAPYGAIGPAYTHLEKQK